MMRRFFFPLVPMLAALVIAPASSAQETKVASLKADVKSKPKDYAASFALGRAYRRAGRWAEAKTELARAASLGTGDDVARARYELAWVEFDQGVTNSSLPAPPSLATCKAVASGTSGAALARVCAAEAWLTFQRTGVASDELDAAAKLDATLYELKLAQAKLDAAKAADGDAITKLKALTVATPGRADGWLWLGIEYLATDKATDAVSALKKARELDADWPEVAYQLSRALPPSTDARDQARAAIAMKPAWIEAQEQLGELELATSGYDAAKTAYEAAMKLPGGDKLVRAHIGYAWTLVHLKKGDEAKKAALAAEALAPNNARARLAHAEALVLLGDVDGAVDTFKYAAGLDTKDPTGLVRAVEVLLDAKEPMKAEAHADAAVAAFPNDGRAWNAKGDTALANGDKKAAREAYKKAIGASQGGIDKAATQKKLDAIK